MSTLFSEPTFTRLSELESKTFIWYQEKDHHPLPATLDQTHQSWFKEKYQMVGEDQH